MTTGSVPGSCTPSAPPGSPTRPRPPSARRPDHDRRNAAQPRPQASSRRGRGRGRVAPTPGVWCVRGAPAARHLAGPVVVRHLLHCLVRAGHHVRYRLPHHPPRPRGRCCGMADAVGGWGLVVAGQPVHLRQVRRRTAASAGLAAGGRTGTSWRASVACRCSAPAP